ncbi:MAG: tetratricopeptide repeat protein, partial [Nitrososphaera sp.]
TPPGARDPLGAHHPTGVARGAPQGVKDPPEMRMRCYIAFTLNMGSRMIRSSLIILSVTVVLLFTVQKYSIAAADDFTLFVNNSPTQSGKPVLVSSGNTVYFEIQQSSNLPIRFDPTGKGDIGYSLNGNLVGFSTAYNAGKYNPIITVGGKTKTIQLVVDQEKVDSAGWFKLISDLSWPLLFLVVFTVLACWEGLRKLILSINQVEVGGVKMKASDLSLRMTAVLENTISTIERKLPQTPARFLPSSLSSDIAHHVRILEFIDVIGAHPGNVDVWNAAGDYYFAHDSTKAEIAYNKAIEQDKNDPNAYANIGMLYLMHKKDSHGAKQHFTTALKLADEMHPCATAHMGMVTIYSNAGDVENEKLHCEQAKNIFQRSVSIDKTDFWSCAFLAGAGHTETMISIRQ